MEEEQGEEDKRMKKKERKKLRHTEKLGKHSYSEDIMQFLAKYQFFHFELFMKN